MGRPFLEYLQETAANGQDGLRTDHSRSDSDHNFDNSSQDENLDLAIVALDTQSSPMQDALHAAETYFQQLEERCKARHDQPRNLFDIIIDETQKPTVLAKNTENASTDDENVKLPAERKGTMPTTDAKLGVPSEFSLDDSDDCRYVSMFPPPAASHSDKLRHEGGELQHLKESSPQVETASLDLVVFKDASAEEHHQNMRDGDSKSSVEWNAILKRSPVMGGSGICSTSSRDSLSDEAISKRAEEWGNGVAQLVLKNSSQDSTPRTSNGSSRSDSFQYDRQIVPVISNQVKDVLSSVQLAFWVCDAIDPENPILYASAGFFEMTGYSPGEVIGRNCRFLQGVDTDVNEASRVSEALKKGEAYTGTLLNYKKNGAPFWNLLTLSPISDDKEMVIKHMGMQAEVSNQTVIARRKRAAHDNNCRDMVKSPCQSIAEFPLPSIPQSRRSERDSEIPVFTPPAARLTEARDQNGRSQGSKRYSLTIAPPRRSVETQASKRHSLSHGPRHSRACSMESWQQRPVGGSEAQSVPTGTHRSLAPQQRLSKSTSGKRPLYWLVTAAQLLEEERQSELGSDKNLVKQVPDKITKDEDRKGVAKNNNKIGRVAKGVFGFFRKLERKILKRQNSIVPSSRVNDYHSDSDTDIDDLSELPTMNNFYSERQVRQLRTESMPHIDSITNKLTQEDHRVRHSSRYVSSMSDILDRPQFCIVHE